MNLTQLALIAVIFNALVGTLEAKNHLVQIKTDNPQVLTQILHSKGFEVEGYSKKSRELGVITEFPFLLLENEGNWGARDVDFRISSITPTESYRAYAAKNSGSLDAEEYLGADAIVAELKKLQSQFPKFAKVYDLNQMLNTQKTVEGNNIYALHVSSSPGIIEDKPKVLIIAQHHARELMTQHAVLDAARELLTQVRREDAKSLRALEGVSIWFVPVLNPDGLNYVLSKDRMWRKNRAKNSGGSRGVDLNRNYGVKWGACGMHSADPASEVYKGPSANSEAETQLIEKLNEKLRFQYAISYHSYGNEVLNPYLCGSLAEAEVINEVRDSLKALTGFGHRPASSSGEDHEHHYNKFGTLSYLLEIGDEFQPNFSVYRNEVWPVVKKVVPFVSQLALENFVHIQLADEESGKGLSGVELSLDQIQYKESEVRETDSFGSYRWRLPRGNYLLTAKAPGYESLAVTFSATGGVDNVVVKLRSK